MLSNDIPPSLYILLFIQTEKGSVNIYFTANNHGRINGASKAFTLLEEKIWNSPEETLCGNADCISHLWHNIDLFIRVNYYNSSLM